MFAKAKDFAEFQTSELPWSVAVAEDISLAPDDDTGRSSVANSCGMGAVVRHPVLRRQITRDIMRDVRRARRAGTSGLGGLGCSACQGSAGFEGLGLGLFDSGLDITGWGIGEWAIVGTAALLLLSPSPFSIFGKKSRQRRRKLRELRAQYALDQAKLA